MHTGFSRDLDALLSLTHRVVASVTSPEARAVDEGCRWPAASMQAFADAGLMGLQAPYELGGHGQGLLALSMVTAAIGEACPSSALCFGMHCVGTAVIAAKATDFQRERYLRAIAEGRHITTLALSESGTGAHFYLPATRLTRAGDDYLVDGSKQFVTNGGHADSYVVSSIASEAQCERGDFSCLIVDADTPGAAFHGDWQGFGMRGNSSRSLRLEAARVPATNLLGAEGDQVWYVFEVVAPYFLMAMAGTYLGIAKSALDAAGEQLRNRRFEHSGTVLGDVETMQTRYAAMWTAYQKSKALVITAAQKGDRGDPDALPFILASKADAGDTAIALANDAMSICGGSAYRENSRVGQMLRDARASHVMSPTTDMLHIWTGRALLGMPLL
ncbi:acyl-CoA dehydrogenase family protein [Pseudoduganella buxea]|uniref:Acyl-CoA dehydrogenase n=1 Tax=Pseudoduganella buxea TaxID=1949069 RepID=A0A6I3SXJ3_9BURK|nr:acyl-CoA dehydrogenase family protein [Pseudoduganella buxea]MTV53794.1 acyl-CoA dehydrogenase [Pseudoduganella buxea]GGC00799.1 acyl-CoA dehydrogenase [Pseudoduganella buxea]